MINFPVDLWLDTQQHDTRHVLIPYVRSAQQRPLRYQIVLERQGPAGNSRIQQGGQVTLTPGKAHALTTLSAGGHAASACELSITLDTADHPAANYRFDCLK